MYYGDDGCGAKQVTVTVGATDPTGVSSVRLYFRLADKAGGGTTGWSSLAMTAAGDEWSRLLKAETDVPGHDSYTNAWLQFYFLATNSRGVQTQSSTYSQELTLSRCIFVR